MVAAIRSPGPEDTRSTQADWVELQTLLSTRGKWTPGDLYGLLDFLEDRAADPAVIDEETGDDLDESILESQRTGLSTSYSTNFSTGNEFSASPTLSLSIRIISASNECRTSRLFQDRLFTSSASLYRLFVRRKIEPLDLGKIDESGIPSLFQICACLAAGGYTAGDVASFGFPRPTGQGFLTALGETYQRFGAGSVRATIPPGFPTSPKDDGIDVIAWRDHPDRMPGKVYLLGQCASGNDWEEKSVLDRIPQFHGWFSQPPAAHYVPSMFIPFTLHRGLFDDPDILFEDLLKSKFLREEMRYGIVFDRCRVVHFSGTCLQMDDSRGDVDGIDQYAEIETWVTDTCEILRSVESA